jgi:hypothetical protein
MNKLTASFAVVLCLAGMGQALADCGGASIKEVTRAYADAQRFEKRGDPRSALGAYAAAQEYTCETNPVAVQAIKRAAALGKTLGDASRAAGQHELAVTYYEQGGHFAAADQALQDWIQAEPDSVALYQRAYDHVANRSLEAFAANNAARLQVTGPYKLDTNLASRVHAMPAQGLERALQAETKSFNENFLARSVAIIKARPADPADLAGQSQWQSAYAAFRQQFPRDHMQDAQRSLDLAKSWVNADRRSADNAAHLKRIAQRADARVSTLTQKYYGAPDALSAALGFLERNSDNENGALKRMGKIRSQAESLGDAALNRANFMLAIAYYDVAGAEAKAQRANEQMQAHVQARMQDSVAAARRDAEAIAAQFSDPDKVEAMKRQAQGAQRALQESAAARATPAAKQAKDDLAKELGL